MLSLTSDFTVAETHQAHFSRLRTKSLKRTEVGWNLQVLFSSLQIIPFEQPILQPRGEKKENTMIPNEQSSLSP